MIYPDASFLVSWLHKPDPLNAKARVWFTQHQADDFFISDWSRFETVNALRPESEPYVHSVASLWVNTKRSPKSCRRW
jgi:predicted nucleic acid-binding protein